MVNTTSKLSELLEKIYKQKGSIEEAKKNGEELAYIAEANRALLSLQLEYEHKLEQTIKHNMTCAIELMLDCVEHLRNELDQECKACTIMPDTRYKSHKVKSYCMNHFIADEKLSTIAKSLDVLKADFHIPEESQTYITAFDYPVKEEIISALCNAESEINSFMGNPARDEQDTLGLAIDSIRKAITLIENKEANKE